MIPFIYDGSSVRTFNVPLSGHGAFNAVNNAGHAVGYMTTPNDLRAILWDGLSLHDLGAGVAHAINDLGVVVGESLGKAFYWDGSRHDIDTLGPGGSSFAYGINNANTIVGSSEEAFLWNGSLQGLGTLGGMSSTARAINEAGLVVGSSTTGPSDFYGHAFLWDNSMQDLGTLDSDAISSALSINDLGHVVGYSLQSPISNGSRAFFWDGTMHELAGFGWSTRAYDINNFGQIVGYSSYLGGESRAVIWENGAIRDLSTVVGLGSLATSINDSGIIVGFVDVPEPVSLNLFTLGTLLLFAGSFRLGANAEVTTALRRRSRELLNRMALSSVNRF